MNLRLGCVNVSKKKSVGSKNKKNAKKEQKENVKNAD